MRRWHFFYWLAGAVLILILSFQFSNLTRFFYGVYDSVSKPLMLMGAGVRDSANGVRFNFGRFWNAVAKEHEYQRQILELRSRLLRFDEMERENRRLNKLLNFAQTLSFKTIGVRIIGEDNTPWRSLIVLDKGSKQGVKPDMVLVAPEGLAGRILDADLFTSRAILLSDPDSSVSALTAQGRIQGVIKGMGTEKLQMKYLALDAEVSIGETVISAGTGSLYPKGLEIGKIESVEKDPDGLHLLAYVRPSVKFSKLEELLCLGSQASK